MYQPTYAYASLDIGQRQDYSAIAVIERRETLTQLSVPLCAFLVYSVVILAFPGR